LLIAQNVKSAKNLYPIICVTSLSKKKKKIEQKKKKTHYIKLPAISNQQNYLGQIAMAISSGFSPLFYDLRFSTSAKHSPTQIVRLTRNYELYKP
jgi:hypothetical protein